MAGEPSVGTMPGAETLSAAGECAIPEQNPLPYGNAQQILETHERAYAFRERAIRVFGRLMLGNLSHISRHQTIVGKMHPSF